MSKSCLMLLPSTRSDCKLSKPAHTAGGAGQEGLVKRGWSRGAGREGLVERGWSRGAGQGGLVKRGWSRGADRKGLVKRDHNLLCIGEAVWLTARLLDR